MQKDRRQQRPWPLRSISRNQHEHVRESGHSLLRNECENTNPCQNKYRPQHPHPMYDVSFLPFLNAWIALNFLVRFIVSVSSCCISLLSLSTLRLIPSFAFNTRMISAAPLTPKYIGCPYVSARSATPFNCRSFPNPTSNPLTPTMGPTTP